MSENTLPAQKERPLDEVIKKIRNVDFQYAVNEKWEKEYLDDKHKKKNTKLIFINKNFTREEQSVLLKASAEELCDALINTQPQTIDWSFDNPYIKWPLVASLCVTEATCIASPCIAVPSIIAQDTAEMLVVLGMTSRLSSLPICIHQSNIQEYEDHGIDEDRSYTEKKR